MTLDQWLQEATGTFPPGIRERLGQEYTAHLEDSVATGGSVNALELFGEPKQVEKRLKKLYYNQKQLTAIFGQKRWVFWVMFGLVALVLLLNIALSLPDGFKRKIPMTAISLYGTALFVMGLLWMLSRSWVDEIKVKFRNQYSLATLGIFNTSIVLVLSDSFMRWFGGAIVIILVVLIPFMVADDERLRRTLKIEAASSHQTSGG